MSIEFKTAATFCCNKLLYFRHDLLKLCVFVSLINSIRQFFWGDNERFLTKNKLY